MAVGFAIATSAFLATFGKYFSKRWFFWFISAVIATIAGMLMNAGNKKQAESTQAGGAPKKDEAPAPSGQAKSWYCEVTTYWTRADEEAFHDGRNTKAGHQKEGLFKFALSRPYTR